MKVNDLELNAKTELDDLIDALDNDIPGVRDAYEANSTEGLVRCILAWAWEDAEREIREEATQ